MSDIKVKSVKELVNEAVMKFYCENLDATGIVTEVMKVVTPRLKVTFEDFIASRKTFTVKEFEALFPDSMFQEFNGDEEIYTYLDCNLYTHKGSDGRYYVDFENQGLVHVERQQVEEYFWIEFAQYNIPYS